jgi:hypothetical protein
MTGSFINRPLGGEYHDATRLLCARFSAASGLCRHFVMSHVWIPAFAAMTHAGLADRDAALFRGVALATFRSLIYVFP